MNINNLFIYNKIINFKGSSNNKHTTHSIQGKLKNLKCMEQYLELTAKLKMSQVNFFVNNLAIKEAELDDIIKNKSIKYVLNPQEAYNKLDNGNKKALIHLVKAAKALDTVFLKQDCSFNIQARNQLHKAAQKGNTHAQKALVLFDIFKGIEGKDGLSDKPVRLFKDKKLAPGKNVYPEDLTRQELISYLKNNIEQAPAILSNNTIVKRKDKTLEAVPYNIEYRDEYNKAAKELLLAAKETTHKGFADYLKMQAHALVCNDPEFSYKADKMWANLKDCPLEFTIGKESYADTLSGSVVSDKELAQKLKDNSIIAKSKDSIGVRVGIVDLPASKKLEEYEDYLKDISLLMPMNQSYTQSIDMTSPGEKIPQTLSDVDLVYLSGDYASCRPGITLAQNLPNDDKLSAILNSGRKNVFHKQVRRTEDPQRRQKMLNSLVDTSQHKWYNKEADHWFTIGHELCHSLGPMATFDGKDKKALLGEGLGDIIEENKADMGSLVAANYLEKINKYTKEQVNQIYLTWAVRQLPLSKPDVTQAHRFREIMQLNYFIENGAINFKENGKLLINPEKFPQTANAMLKDVIQLQLDGDANKVKAFTEKYGKWTPALEYAGKMLKSLSPKPYKIIEVTNPDSLS